MLFSASQDLATTRSKCFLPPESNDKADVWHIKAPDFSYKLYQSTKIPQRRSRTAYHAVAQPSETHRKIGKVIKEGLMTEIANKNIERPTFITRYRPPDSLESKLIFVETGKYPSGPFKNPKPHNFRPVRNSFYFSI